MKGWSTTLFKITLSVMAIAITEQGLAAQPLVGEVEQIAGDAPLKWSKPFQGEANDLMIEFTRAMKGKDAQANTKELMHGVSTLSFLPEGLMLTRQDNAKLLVLKTSVEGKKMVDDWETAQRNAEKQFGPNGRAFLASIEEVRQDGDRLEIHRAGRGELLVELGKKKLHHAFDLKAIRFSNIGFEMGEIKGHPALMDLTGVTVLVNAPGFTLPVEVKQFCKWKKPSGEMDVTVGVKTPVPGAIRTILFLPRICQFHFVMPKKPEDNESAKEAKSN